MSAPQSPHLPGRDPPSVRDPQCELAPRQPGALSSQGVATPVDLDPEGAATVIQPPSTDPGTLEQDRPRAGPVEDKAALCVGGYEVLEELGHGGMGVVHKARHRTLGRVVALKMIRYAQSSGPHERRRFRTEAEAVARLQHPHVVQVFEVGEHEGQPYIALEWMEGGSLARRLSGQPMSPLAAAQLVEPLARAVHHAHQRGVVHRDLKPANILLSAEGTPKVADFGLAKRLDREGQTQTGVMVGTPRYMAPEQADGKKEVGPAADIWALGAILYELLTGRPAFRAATPMDTLWQVLTQEPVAVRRLQPKVPKDLETICLKCLEKDPKRRYASAEALAEDLRRFGAGEAVKARPLGRVQRGFKWVRRHPAAAVAYALVLLVVVLGGLGSGVTWMWQHSEHARAQLAHEKRQSEAARQEAEAARARLAEISYLRQIGLAHREWQEAEVARAEQLLESCPAEKRGWEWHYVRRLCHADVRTRSGAGGGLAFSPDGRCLASASADHAIVLWDARTGQEITRCQGHTGAIQSIAFSPDGRSLLSASKDHSTKVWDVRSGQQRFSLYHRQGVRRAVFSPDGRIIATAGESESIQLWEAQSGSKLQTFRGLSGPIHGVTFSPDGRQLVGWGVVGKTDVSGKGEVRVWDRQSGQELLLIGHPSNIVDVAISPDGRRLAGACADKTIPLWDAQSGRVLFTLSGHSDRVSSVAFSPDGAYLASGADQTVRVWNAATAQEVVCHKGHKSFVAAVAFSPDGRRLASSSWDGTVKVWRALADPQADRLAGHARMIAEVKVSPDGQTIASASSDGTIRLWDRACPRRVLCIPAHASGVESIALSPNGKRLVSGGKDGLIKIWDARTGQEILSWTAHPASIWSVACSPDGTRIASVSCAFDPQAGQTVPWRSQALGCRIGEGAFHAGRRPARAHLRGVQPRRQAPGLRR